MHVILSCTGIEFFMLGAVQFFDSGSSYRTCFSVTFTTKERASTATDFGIFVADGLSQLSIRSARGFTNNNMRQGCKAFFHTGVSS